MLSKLYLLRYFSKILLLQVRYCENEVDCRRYLQLVHFGEKFDSTNCKNTCDNCSSSQTLVDKDVTLITRQLVWELFKVHHLSHLLDVLLLITWHYLLCLAQVELVKQTGERFSSSHILEVYRGSFNQMVCINNNNLHVFQALGGTLYPCIPFLF